MTTISQLIAYLETLPQGAVVEILQSKGAQWGGEVVSCIPLDLANPDHITVTDFRGNQFVKADSPHYNKIYVEIGERA